MCVRMIFGVPGRTGLAIVPGLESHVRRRPSDILRVKVRPKMGLAPTYQKNSISLGRRRLVRKAIPS